MAPVGGISFYFIDGVNVDHYRRFFHLAASCGIKEAFTSFQFGLQDVDLWKRVIEIALKEGIHVTADVTKKTFEMLDAGTEQLGVFNRIGLSGIRLDYGFTLDEVANMSFNNVRLKIGVNPILRTDERGQWLDLTMDTRNVFGCFNYYPRKETGISFAYFREQLAPFVQRKVPVNVFIPGSTNKRGPLYEGLPTLEAHRLCGVHTSSSTFHRIPGVGTVFIGDPFVDLEEMQALVEAVESKKQWIKIKLAAVLSVEERRVLYATEHRLRVDEAEQMHRLSTGRLIVEREGMVITPRESSLPRNRGTVTIDNDKYGRYKGELHINKYDLPVDPRVNVLATIADEDWFLIDQLKGGDKIQFYE